MKFLKNLFQDIQFLIMVKRQITSLFFDAFDWEINSMLGVHNFHDHTPFLILAKELKWKADDSIEGNIYWTVYGELSK